MSPKPGAAETGTLTIRGLSCVRGDHLLFENLSLVLDPGGVCRIDGANGAGKTSLLRIVCGMAPAESGEVLWHGRPIRRQRIAYRASIAYVGHQHGIKDDLTAAENLRLAAALSRRRAGVSPSAALKRLGLAGYDDAPCRHLSAGQKRRVALSRLVLADAPLWILDEPANAIDRAGIALLESLLDEHLDGGGMILMTSHLPLALGRHPVTTVTLG